MEYKNVVNGVACSMAKVSKETEKALCVSFVAEIYGTDFTIKNQWLPKSQIDVKKSNADTIWFVPKNDWILDAKCRDYAKFVAGTFDNIVSEIRTYLSNINSEKVTMVWV